MPHLPPITIIGGSVKLRVPVGEVNEQGQHCGEVLFRQRDEPVVETYPPDSNKKYALAQYSASDKHAQIYSIEIHGEDEGEVFEFRPKKGRCRVEIYYALSDELPLTHESTWLEKGGHGKSDHPHGGEK